jgi:colanic acid/amylovoran biosynthesis glycosyltransferase
MHVAYLINQYPKVSHSFIRREILALERQKVDVLRIALRGWDGEVVDKEDIVERERTRYVLSDGMWPLFFAVIRAFLTRPAKFLRAFLLILKMSRGAERPFPVHVMYLAEACRILFWLKEFSIEHVHAHFGTNSAEVAMLAHTLGGPTWSFTVHGPEEFDKAPLIGLAEKIRSSTFVVAISFFGRSQLYRLVDRAQWRKIHVIHCGVDSTFLDAASRMPEGRKLVCVGRLCEQKGQFLLIEAAQRLAKEGIDFQLTLAGDGELRSEIEGLIEQLGLSDKVSITGWISGEQVRCEILASRALVLPSFAEGLPVVLMESMVLLRPVISTYIAGIPELVENGKSGWLVPAGDVDALCDAMRACLLSPISRLMDMGQTGRQTVLAHHDVAKESEKLFGLFKQVRTL